MPPVVFAAVAGAVSAAATAWATGAAITATLIATSATISAGLAAASMALAPKQKPFRQEITDRTHSVRQPITSRQIVYGTVKTGGPIVYLQSTAGVAGTQPNKWLQLVIPLAAHEVEAIDTVYFDGEALPLGPDGAVTGGKYYDSKWPVAAERPRARVWKHLGQPGQAADARLVSMSGGKWTNAHVGHGVAYLYVELEYTASIYTSGIPNITAVVRGKKVLDPRTGTVAFSDNAALCIYDYLRTSVQDGGVGAASDEFDTANLTAAANLCDEAVPLAAGGTEKRYTINGTVVLSSANTPRNTLEAMLTACGGSVVYSGGRWRLLPAAYRNPTVTLTDADLRGPVNVTTATPARELFTGVKGTFSSPANQWQPADYPAVQSDPLVAAAGGEPRWKEIDRPFTTSAAMAQRLAKIDLLRGRQPVAVTLPCKLTAFRVRSGDVVRLTLPRLGWTAKPFEVAEWQFAVAQDGTLGVDLALRETDPSIFDWATSEDQPFDPAPNTDLPDWRDVPTPRNVSVDSAASRVLEGTDGSLVSRALVTWDRALDAFVERYELHWRITGEASWPYQQTIDGSGDGPFSYPIDNVPVGVSLDVRIRAVNGLGVPSNFVTITGHTVTGYSARPNPPITGLKVVGSPAGQPGLWNADSVTFAWNEATTLGIVFDAYLVTVRNSGPGGTVRRTVVTRQPSFTYDYASNAADGLVREFVLEVQARTRLGGLSTATSLTATNPAPPLPTNTSLTGEFRNVALRYTPPPDPDWSGIRVWRGTVTGFTANDASLVYDGSDTLVVLPAEPGTAYFLRWACYDLFGKVGLTVSGEQTVSTVRISHADLVGQIIDATNLLPTLSTRIDKIDAAGTGLLDRVTAAEGNIVTETTQRTTADTALGSRVDRVQAGLDRTAYLETFDRDAAGFTAEWSNRSGAGELSIEPTGGVAGGKFLRIGNNSGNDSRWMHGGVNIPYDPNRLYRISWRVRRTAGTGFAYLGLSCFAADGTTYVDNTGGSGNQGSHWLVLNQSTGVGATWETRTAYFKGTGTPVLNGTSTATSPSPLHASVRYFRPAFVANWSTAAGTFDIDAIAIEFADADAAAAAVQTEATARVTADDSLGTRIDTVAARTDAGFSAALTWRFPSATGTLQGWTAHNATMALHTDGTARLTATLADSWIRSPAGLAIDGRANPLVRVRMTRRVGTGWDGGVHFVTAGHGEGSFVPFIANPSTTAAQTVTAEWDMSAVAGTDWTTATVTQLRIDLSGAAGDMWDIEWIAVGAKVPAASVAVVQAETTARTTALTAEATARQTLQARVDARAFTDTFEYSTADIATWWTSHEGAGEMTVETTGGESGGRLLRIGNNSGADTRRLTSTRNVAYDPNRLYRITFRARRTAGTGTVYLGVAGIGADGTTLLNAAGQSGQFGSQYYVAADAVHPPATWTVYTGYLKGIAASTTGNGATSATSPRAMVTGTKYFRPFVLANWQNVAGTVEIDSVTVEIADTEAAVQVEATTRADVDTGLLAQYTVKVQAGTDYVAGFGLASTVKDGTPTSDFSVLADRFSIVKPGSVALNNPVVPFVVSTQGSTPVLSFAGYASFDRMLTGTLTATTLYLGNTDVVLDGPSKSIRVNWGGIEAVRIGELSAGVMGMTLKNSSGQTLLSTQSGFGAGAVPPAALSGGSGVNLLYNADFQVNTDGWTAMDNNTGQAPHISIPNVLNFQIPGAGPAYFGVAGTAPAGTFFVWANHGANGQRYPVRAGVRYEASARLSQWNAVQGLELLLSFYDGSGTWISNHSGGNVTDGGAITQLSDMAQTTVFATAPSNAVTAMVRVYAVCNGGANPAVAGTQFYLGEAGASQSVASPWVPGPSPLKVAGIGGLGGLATRNSVNPQDGTVTGLGALATANTVNWNGGIVNMPAFGNFAYLSTITSANVSTYISSAAIGDAHVSSLSAAKLSAGLIDAANIAVRYGDIRVWDSNNSRWRVWIGHYPGVDYGFWVWAADGTEVMSASGINGGFINALTVNRISIKDNAINGVKIEDLSASNTVGASANANTVGVFLQCTGKPVTVIASALVTVDGGGNAYLTGTVNLVSDGVTVVAGQPIVSGWMTTSAAGTIVHTFTPAAGGHNFFVTPGSGGVINRCSIWVIENRK